MSTTNWPPGLPLSSTEIPDSASTHHANDWFVNVVKPISDGIVYLDGDSPTWINPTLSGSWAWFGAGYPIVGYQTWGAVVRFRGWVKSGGSGVGNPILTMPTAYRPSSARRFTAQANNSTAALVLDTAGRLYVAFYASGGSNAFVSLSGVRYVAD